MRLHLQLSATRERVPFNHYHLMVSVFNRWLGPNDLHDALSLYSLSGLQGGGARDGALSFSRGAQWFISAPDTDAGAQLLQRVAAAALQSPEVCCGMEVQQIESQLTPEFGPKRVFRASSPVFIRGDKEGDLDPHILYNDPRAAELLTRTLRHKLDKAGLGEHAAAAQMSFDPTFRHPKTRLIHIKDSFYKRANVCPVIVEGGEAVTAFAWNVGAGNLCGCCFGSLI